MLELELTPEFEPRELFVPANIETVVREGGGSLSNELKEALLQMAQNVAYINAEGQSYYDDLYRALYPVVILIADFNQGESVVYHTDDLDSLRSMLTVTAMYGDSTSEEVTDYTLAGDLTPGTSVITVSFGGKTTTFEVSVTRAPGLFRVANTLVGCTNSNSATTATEGTAYSGTITAASGYTLAGATVSVTMRGVDITSAAYSNGTISIAAVTGDVAISVTAVAVVLSSISAEFTQGQTVVHDTDSLDSLKSMLTVTATYSDSSTATVPSTDYTLSGTLTEGTSTVTVSYGGKTDTFDVVVTAPSQGDIFGVFTAGYSMGTKTSSSVGASDMPMYAIWNNASSGRAAMTTPIVNKGYVITSTDPSKYTLSVKEITNDTPVSTSYSNAVTGRYYQGTERNATAGWNTSDSVTSPYMMIVLKKNSGDFTAEELANGAEAVFTFTRATS